MLFLYGSLFRKRNRALSKGGIRISSFRTIPSAPEFHRFNPSGATGYAQHSGFFTKSKNPSVQQAFVRSCQTLGFAGYTAGRELPKGFAHKEA
jgi:hypothetical protein